MDESNRTYARSLTRDHLEVAYLDACDERDGLRDALAALREEVAILQNTRNSDVNLHECLKEKP